MSENYQICNRCVMDTSDPEIIFDENGHCNHCNDFLNQTIKKTYQGKKTDIEIENFINQIKHKGKSIIL